MITLSPVHHVQPGSLLYAVGYYAPHATAQPHLLGNMGFAMYAAVQAWAHDAAHPDTPPARAASPRTPERPSPPNCSAAPPTTTTSP
jgi:hypothetical protein